MLQIKDDKATRVVDFVGCQADTRASVWGDVVMVGTNVDATVVVVDKT